MLFLIWLQWQRALAMDSQWELLLPHQVRIYSNVCRSACILKKHKQIHLITLYIIFTTELAKCNWPWWDSICLFLPGSDGAFWMWRLNNLTCIYSLSKKQKTRTPWKLIFLFINYFILFKQQADHIFFFFFFSFLLKLWVNEIIGSPVVTHHFSQALSKKLRKGDEEEKVVPHWIPKT